MDRKDGEIYRSFVQVKLDALKERKFTDCCFMVGDDDEEQEEFSGVKFDLMVVSGFMEGMFNSPLPQENPIRIKNVKPKSFSMIMEFAHVGRVISTCDCLEVAELAIAADHLLINSLTPVCIELIQSTVTVDKVWPVLDLLLKFDLTEVASGCHKVLSEKTEMCLQEEAFLTTSKESVGELLKLKQMFIASEKRLLDYCFKWAQNTSDERDSLRTLLPGLRLFTLKAREAACLPKFLTAEEDAELLRFFITDKLGINPPEKLNTCLETRHQNSDVEQVLVTSSDYDLAHKTNCWKDLNNCTNELLLTTNVDIYITKFTMKHAYSKKTEKNDTYQLTFLKVQAPQNVIKVGRQADGSATVVSATVSSINWSTFELTCLKPILLQKNDPMRILIAVHVDGYFRWHYVHVPCSTLHDLSALSDTTQKHFKQLQFKRTDHPIFLQSFSHHLAY